ncbi:TetR family transcriptional regulator [Conexibacter sp. JD483]|uniref:TetR/AcrR family transcriptional regulator n=1 Tax=unclassified Conexibacter TaxID=2627773 RepID=UPI0027202603|nr:MULTISPECIES: TetR family transcriptional regulator [unclassified Conexibacter]MDO8188967.1 TetR family transcriptional regulator [Conexibacter sp. CPCC 205706]MDO8201775.1 TetR family transcriptional regulator [Conexibacter sp. CPCC 205762]MDR9371440.1 TetR family transcriptional regulator [Conexibacter sp. JD483]
MSPTDSTSERPAGDDAAAKSGGAAASDGGVVRPYRGIPADARVAQRRARLLSAALEEIAAGGVAALSVRATCTRAGLTRRYFYESFSDLDALLVAAFDDLHREIADAIVAALAAVQGAPFDARARAAIGAGLTIVLETPAKARLLVAAGGEHGALAARRADAVDAFATLVADAIATPPGPAAPASPIAARMVTGGLIETVDAWLRGAVELTEQELVAEAARLASALASAG